MNQFISRELPPVQNIMSVPIHKNSTPYVPSGADPNARNNSISPPHKDDNTYCNTLPPAPRSQLVNYPIKTNYYGDCPYNPKAFNKNSCYLLDSKSQGVYGYFCNNTGGSKNSDFVRGNVFGLNSESLMKMKEKEYTVEIPNVMKINSPAIVFNSPFYPDPGFLDKYNPNYKTYPYTDDYVAGEPSIKYPYHSLNSIEQFVGSIKTTKNVKYLILFIIIIVILYSL